MASFGTGFAGGLLSGMSMGRMLMDTYNDAKLKDELEAAGKLAPEEIAGSIDQDTQKSIETMRSHVGADGKNTYEVENLSGGGARFRAAGDGDWTTIAPGKQYKMGGLVQDNPFTDAQISKARGEAIADVYARNGDPMKGLQYKNASREDRSASAIEAAREEYMSGLEDMASGRNMDKYIPMILKSYNDAKPGSKHDDGHHATYDPERGVVAFANKDGQIVNTIPVNQQTLAAAWKERYMDKIAGFDPKLGIEVDKVRESGRHNRNVESIAREGNDIKREGLDIQRGQLGLEQQRINKMGQLNDLQKYELEQRQKFDVVKADLQDQYEKGTITEKQYVRGLNAAAVKFGGHMPTEKASGGEAQVEYDDGAGTKIKGTDEQVHNTRMKRDGAYRAANGGSNGLTMPPPANVKPGETKAKAERVGGYSDASLDVMISDAQRGGITGRRNLQEMIESNELTPLQRRRAEAAIAQR